MKIKEFFKILRFYYNDGVNYSKIRCKFYAQAETFSYDLYKFDDDRMIQDLSSDTQLVFRSKVFDSWIDDEELMQEIIEEIIQNTNQILMNDLLEDYLVNVTDDLNDKLEMIDKLVSEDYLLGYKESLQHVLDKAINKK